MIDDPSAVLTFSAANIWEVAIKAGLRRSDFDINAHILRQRLIENEYELVRISDEHALGVAGLPDIHKDPFDRILIAQATIDGLTLLTSNPVVASYPGPIVLV